MNLDNIKIVVFDFDGVFTNGNIIIDNDGNIIKHYNVKDGMGLSILKKNGYIIGCISGYSENISQRKILERFNIEYISLNDHNKLQTLDKWLNKLNLLYKNVAYIGDDINDIEIMNKVAFSCCPNDAHAKCKIIVDYVLNKNGGNGAIRELADILIQSNLEKNIIQSIRNEVNYQLDNIPSEDINTLCLDILKVKQKQKNIYFTGIGKSENISKHICSLLKSIGLQCYFLNCTNSLHGDIGSLNNDDLVILISNSGNTQELIQLIPFLKKRNCILYGICGNFQGKFHSLCDKTIVLPFQKELNNNSNKPITSIPTNSYMSQMLFGNILVIKMLNYMNLTIEKYRSNHPAGNIGNNLKTIKDILITEYPKIKLDRSVPLNDILLEMTKYSIGCCFFVDKNNNLLGLLTDGDIRRLLINSSNLNIITKNNINTKYHYETDENKLVIELKKLNKNYKFIPIIKDKLIGIIKQS